MWESGEAGAKRSRLHAVAMTSDIWCRMCGHSETLQRALRADDKCPACGANVYRRKGPPPSPRTHVGQVVRALFSLRGVFFLVGLAIVSEAASFHYALVVPALMMLTLASLKLATRAMRVDTSPKSEGVEFPEVSAEELFDRTALLPALVFALVFLVVPGVLFTIAWPEHREQKPPTRNAAQDMADLALGITPPASPPQHARAHDDDADGDEPGDLSGFDDAQVDPALQAAIASANKRAPPPRANEAPPVHEDEDTSVLDDAHASLGGLAPALMGLALLLLLYAPMALVMFLRTGTTWALFFVPQGIATIVSDVKAYAGLCAFAVPAFGSKILLDRVADALPFYVEPFLLVPRNALILVAWGVCGLYVRQRARTFDMPVDEDDWVPHTPMQR